MSKSFNKTVPNFHTNGKESIKSFHDEDSLSDLKNKMTFEKLKENLTSRMLTATSRDGLIFKDTLCETEKNFTLKSTIKKMVELKRKKIHLSKELVTQKTGMCKKEKLRLDLMNEYLHYKYENDKLKDDVFSNEKFLLHSKENFNRILKYCEHLKVRFKDFVETVNNYEEKIKRERREKDEIVKKYEANLAVLSNNYL